MTSRSSGAGAARPLRWGGLAVGLSLLLSLLLALAPLLLPPPATDSAEVRFLHMMVPHHAQAVQLVQQADAHLRDPEVRALAQNIR